MKKKNNKELIAKYGLNNPFLVNKTSNRHCVFVVNPATKRINSVFFDKYDLIKTIKVTPTKLKSTSINKGLLNKSVKRKIVKPTQKQLLNKKFWINNYLNGKMTIDKMNKYRIEKGKIKR